MPNFLRLILAIIICQLAGIIGAFFTTPSIPTWYASLTKPAFNPPNYVFGPVWTILYLLMGISLYFILQDSKKSREKKKGLIFFFLQLVLNSFWSIVFFGSQSILGGLIIILILWFLIFQTIIHFAKINKTSAYLLYPYLLWVSFATILNLSIYFLNP